MRQVIQGRRMVVLGGGALGALTALLILRFGKQVPLSSLIIGIFWLLQRWRLAARSEQTIRTILEELSDTSFVGRQTAHTQGPH